MSAFLAIDLTALLAAVLATIACGTLGNWLVLRKESMTADAIAHAVLPGLVAGYLVSGSRSMGAMLAGAAIAGIASVLLSAAIRARTRLEAGASLGVVFTAFFALGVVLLETQGARQIDLDPSCVLFGSLETLFVAVPEGGSWFAGVPGEVWLLLATAAAALAFHALLAKELAALAFDPLHARLVLGSPRAVERALLAATSAAIVASFAAVGSILVLALVACPALLAAPHARSAGGQLALGLAISIPLVAAAYFAAAHAPSVFGTATALNAAGMIAVLLVAAVPASHAVARVIRRLG